MRLLKGSGASFNHNKFLHILFRERKIDTPRKSFKIIYRTAFLDTIPCVPSFVDLSYTLRKYDYWKLFRFCSCSKKIRNFFCFANSVTSKFIQLSTVLTKSEHIGGFFSLNFLRPTNVWPFLITPPYKHSGRYLVPAESVQIFRYENLLLLYKSHTYSVTACPVQ